MGRKLDALLGRSFKAYKFKPLVNLSISRLVVLKNQRQARCTQARSDVLNLLHLGHHDTALLQAEQVIKEQKMLDVYHMLETYINIVVERIDIIEHQRVCPDELREAVSGLVYAASRCGDFPELQELRAVFTTRFGKEFAASAIELRNNCGVNPKLLQKMSTRQPELETKMKVLTEIASENDIVLQLEEASSDSIELQEDLGLRTQNQFEPGPSTNSSSMKLGSDLPSSPDAIRNDDGFTESMQTRRKYRDVADAAEAAFQSAAHAAAAARAAVELSRFKPDSPHSPNTHPRKISSINEQTKVGAEDVKNDANLKREVSSSSSDSGRDNLAVPTMSFDGAEQIKLLEKDLIFDESDNEDVSARDIPMKVEAGLKVHHSDKAEGTISVRTRQVRGY